MEAIAMPEKRLAWHRVRAGRYITSSCSGDMTDRDGMAFLIRHMTVERNHDGSWDAWFVNGDEQDMRIALGAYRTMAAARVSVERAVMRLDLEGRRS